MNPALQLDYFFIGAAIKTRLVAQITELAIEGAILDIEGLDQAVQRSVAAPTAFIGWDGDFFSDIDTERAAGGRSTKMQQGWSVVIAARNATQQAGAFRDDTVGPLLAKVHTALAGWTPEGAMVPLRRVQGRRAQYLPNSGLYPLAFQVQLSL